MVRQLIVFSGALLGVGSSVILGITLLHAVTHGGSTLVVVNSIGTWEVLVDIVGVLLALVLCLLAVVFSLLDLLSTKNRT